ncbi:MAG: hypothetical protein G01um10148_425 [Parcubacteria group bacterium Gr01-1014_8]|nr:MAG: hypothetical protein G01um10148_425 [Parcubacteria group bacterium Gr01-1014_8]
MEVNLGRIKGNVMFIIDLEVLEAERAAGINSKLVKSLKEQALRQNCKYLWWTAGSEDMDAISAKLRGTFHDPGQRVGGVIIPIENLDMRTLVNASRAARGVKKDGPEA